jgi:K+-sensing histidine kinase KdpD
MVAARNALQSGVVNAVIASSQQSATLQFQVALSGFTVHHFENAEQLLLEISALEPRVILIHDSFRGTLPPPDVAALLSRRPELRAAWIVGIGATSSAAAFYGVGLTEFESEPLEEARFKARLEAALRFKQQQLDLWQRVEQLELRHVTLRDDERMKDRLTHMLVHDLKNPIGAIMGAIDFVRADAAKFLPVQHRQLIEMAFEESQHLLHMTTNILDVRKMRDGKLMLEPRPMPAAILQSVLMSSTDDIGAELRQRRTRWRIPEDLPVFHADAEVLRRVFANLISNAVKHTSANGRIQIEAKASGEFVELGVHDDGEGIPEEDLERIFNDFERSRVTNTTRFDTGMGLAFCKLAVEQHGGRIWARSVRGRGSSFYFTLPLNVPQNVEDDLVELLD